jgi:hypothetical protein
MPDHRDAQPTTAWRWLTAVALLIAPATLAVVLLQLNLLLRNLSLGISDTPPAIRSTGPTQVQLERLKYLVTTRVHVADVLVGESRWLAGSWIIQGDALIGVDMSKAEITNRDDKALSAVIALPQPAALSARVNHEKSQQWDVKSRTWIPMAASLLGNRQAMEQEAMLEAQHLVERAAASDDNIASARRSTEGILSEFYRAVGWRIVVLWKR